MIVEFRDSNLEDLFVNGSSSKIDKKLHRNILLILDHLNGASGPRDCTGVKNFHPLKGDRKGEYSMHVNGNFCVTFVFEGQNVRILDLEDYH